MVRGGVLFESREDATARLLCTPRCCDSWGFRLGAADARAGVVGRVMRAGRELPILM